jgi:hypothetical protein
MSTFKLLTHQEFENWLNNQSVSRIIKLVQNHHTFIPNKTHFKGNNHLALQLGMERSHLERGFSQIAQHFTTFPDGQIMTGRSLNDVPAGIKGANNNGICIEHLGNFDLGGDVMTNEHKETIILINSLILKKFNLTPSENTIVYHHWYDLNSGKQVEEGKGSTKSCPGSNFFTGNTKVSFNSSFLPLIKERISHLNDVNTSETKSILIGRVIVNTLNVRSGPGVSNSIVDKIIKGTEVHVFNETNGWSAIDSLNTRWIKSEFIEKI